jgi:ammonium transporter Rh
MQIQLSDSRACTCIIIAIQLVVMAICGSQDFALEHHGLNGTDYGFFRDVNTMLFFALSFLYCYLHRHGLSAVGYCFVVGALTVEMSLVAEYLLNKGEEKKLGDDIMNPDGMYLISMENLLNSLFCVATVNISFGAIIGKVTLFQFIVFAIFETIFYWVNIRFVFTEMGAHDVGGGMVIHVFAAYFGVASSWWVTQSSNTNHKDEHSIYSSDLFSLAGTAFLWILWPSFQAAVAGEPQRQYFAVANTFLSLCGAVIAFGCCSRLVNNNKFDVVHLQNATLAGGVMMGTAGDIDMGIHGAMAAGFGAGAVSCFGYAYIQPLLVKINLHDTAGIHNLHGMPGMMAALLGVIMASIHGKDPGPHHTRGFEDDDEGFGGLSVSTQLSGWLCSLGLAIGSGFLTGFIITKGLQAIGLGIVPEDELYGDRLFFGASSDYDLSNEGVDDIEEDDSSNREESQTECLSPKAEKL